MKFNKLVRENTAVAGVIEALLLVALVAVILSTIQLVYIPQIMEEREANHMDEVADQFSNLKSVIEIQSMMGSLDTGDTVVYSPISSSITLGSKELPYFVSARSYGEVILIDEDDVGTNKINIQPMSIGQFGSGIPLTSINYEAFNSEFVDQVYALEGGGIILNQSEGEVMRVNPSIAVENNSAVGNIKIYWTIPIFNGVPGKKSYGGWGYYKDCFIRSNYSNHYTHSGSAWYIYIYSNHLEAWNHSLVDTISGMLREAADNGYLIVDQNTSVIPNRVEIKPGSKTLMVDITIVRLEIQVGPGAVISKS